MRHLNADLVSEMSGDDDLGEVHEGPDGNLYEWVEGVDAWGDSIGFWQGLTEVDADDPSLGGLGALYQAADGLLYQMQGLEEEEAAEAADAPPAEDAGDEPSAPKMGPGRRPGEIRVGPDGKRYRWVRGIGAGGKPTGFWKRLRPRPGVQPAAGPRARPGGPPARRPRAQPSGRKRKPILKRLLPFEKSRRRSSPSRAWARWSRPA